MNIIQVGLGSLGQMIVRHALFRTGLKVVAAMDLAPDKVGKDLGLVCGCGSLGLKVGADLASALKGKKAEVALLSTVSELSGLEHQVIQLAEAGLHIVSTCEELMFAWQTQPERAARIDKICQAHGVACLGTGINPGFLMDYLPTVLTAVCQRVDRVKVTRIQDAASRRISFQQKIGVGLSLAQANTLFNAGKLGHVGLKESMHIIAHRLGWRLNQICESMEWIQAKSQILSGYVPVEPGMIRGMRQIGQGYVQDEEVITLDFVATVGESQPRDAVEISGEPNIQSVIQGGINGDVATCAIALNAVRSIVHARPGLRTMLEIPTVAYVSRF